MAKRSTAIYVALLLLLMTEAHAGAAEVTFTSTDTPPYWSSTMPDDGWFGSILKLLSGKAGVSYHMEYLPVKRFRESKSPYIVGDPDILRDTSVKRAVFPIGVFNSAFFFYTPRHKPVRFRNLKQMKGLTLGVLRGTLEDKETFENAGIRVEESDTDVSLLRKLERGRIDFSIMLLADGLYSTRQLFPLQTEKFASVDIPGTERPIAIMVDLSHPEGKEIASHYRRELEKFLNSPQYHAILEKNYGTGKVPSGYHDSLYHYVRHYANTWEK